MIDYADIDDNFKRSLKEIKIEAEELKKVFDSFFDFNIILISETGSKTSINRDYIYESNHILKQSTAIINAVFDEMFLSFKNHILELIPKKDRSSFEFTSFVFDNELFLNDISKIITTQKDIDIVKKILSMKDRLFNFKYILSKTNTLPVYKKVTKMTLIELQDSQTMFSIINYLGMLANNFYDFYRRLDHFEENYVDEVDLDLSFLDSMILFEMVSLEDFRFQNRKYRFLLDYTNLSNLSEVIHLDKVYLGNILSNFIHQACLDIIKKESVSTKSDRTITLTVDVNKRDLTITCVCDGIHSGISEDSFFLDPENKSLILAKNLIAYTNGKLKLTERKDSLLEYKVSFKLNKLKIAPKDEEAQ